MALLDGQSTKWDHNTSGSEEEDQIDRICRMNNTAALAGPIQFKFNRTQNVPLKTSPATNDVLNNDEETNTPSNSNKKKRLHKPDESFIDPVQDDSQAKKAKLNDETEVISTSEDPVKVVEDVPPVASTTNEKKSTTNDNRRSRSSSDSSSRRHGRRRRRHSDYHRRRHRRRSSSSTSRSSDSSTSSSDSSRSSSSRSRSSRSSSRSSSSSSDRHRHRRNRTRRSSRSSSRSYSRHRSSTSRSSYSTSSSRSSRSRSRSRRRSLRGHPIHSNNKGRGGANQRRGGRGGGRNFPPVRRRAPSNENSRRPTPNRNGFKYNGNSSTTTMKKLPMNNKPPRVLPVVQPKTTTITTSNPDDLPSETNGNISSTTGNEEIKTETIILTTNPNLNRNIGQKKNGKGKNKQQTPAYSLKRDDLDEIDQSTGEPMIGPKLPPEYEKKTPKDHSFTPPDLDDPENSEMLELKYRAEIHAAKNHGLITEVQAQQLINEHETQKQLAELPLIQMPILPTPSISTMTPFLLAAPSQTIAAYQLPMATAAAAPPPQSTLTSTSPVDPTSTTTDLTLQQQQQLSPHSAGSNHGDERSTPNQTATSVLTSDGQQMMIQTTSGNVNPQLVQLGQPTQQLFMPMPTAVQQPRVVALRTAQGGIQHFIEYPTAQLLQAQQQQQQTQFIQHNGQLVQVIRPQMGYPSAALIQQLQLQAQQQQQQQQVFAAQLQAQQIAAMQQTGAGTTAGGGAIFLQNSAGQIVLAQANPQAMRVVQIPYVPN